MEYTPKDLREKLGIPNSTLQGYLRDEELFPPFRRNENNHRFYNDTGLKKLVLLRTMMRDPFRLKSREIKSILLDSRVDIDSLNNELEISSKNLLKFLREHEFIE